jgi:lysophospholipase L1-like esterase
MIRKSMPNVNRRHRPVLRVVAALVVATSVAIGIGPLHGTVNATNAPRTTPAPAAPATLLVLGDSLTWGANYFSRLHQRLSTQGTFDIVVVDGWWSRRIGGIVSTKYSGVNTLRALRKAGVNPAAVIVGLGTNDVQFLGKPAQYAPLIEELLTEIGPVPVAWLNVHRVETATTTRRSRIFNRTLATVAGSRPNVTVVDWAAVVSAAPRLMAFDKIHLQPSGYEARTKLVLDVATDVWNRHAIATTPSHETSPETTMPAPTSPVPPDTSTTTVPANG